MSLKIDPKNANKGTDRGREFVKQSLKDLGAGRSILATGDDTIIAGNKTWEAAQDLKIPTKIVETDGTELIVVKRTDLQSGDAEAIDLGLRDNRASELGLQWDQDNLQEIYDNRKDVDLGKIWESHEIGAIIPQYVPQFDPVSAEEQGRLDETSTQKMKCPHCGHEFEIK